MFGMYLTCQERGEGRMGERFLCYVRGVDQVYIHVFAEDYLMLKQRRIIHFKLLSSEINIGD